jgi:hypothetical protein
MFFGRGQTEPTRGIVELVQSGAPDVHPAVSAWGAVALPMLSQ